MYTIRMNAAKAESLRKLVELDYLEVVKLIRADLGLDLGPTKHVVDQLRFATYKIHEGLAHFEIPHKILDLPFHGHCGVIYIVNGLVGFAHTDESFAEDEFARGGYQVIARVRRVSGNYWVPDEELLQTDT